MYENGGNSFAEGYAIGRDSSGNNGGWGNSFGGDGWWILLLLLLGWGNGGWGNGNGFGGGGVYGYEIGKLATTNDVASGFNNSAVLSSLNDLKLGQAGIQQSLCQGFNGTQQTIMQGFHGVDNAVCNLGFNIQNGINGISREISDCCCQTQRAIDAVNYNAAKNACDIQNTIHSTTRDIIDSQRDGTSAILNFLTNEKISSLQAENAALTAQLSNNAQTQTLINTLRPVAQPAYITCSPYQSMFGIGYGYNNCGCGCNNNCCGC